MKIGCLVLPKKDTLLDNVEVIAVDETGPVDKFLWKMSVPGIVMQLEMNLPPSISEINRLVRVMTPDGLGWCFLDEIDVIDENR